MAADKTQITRILNELADGRESAAERLLPVVYDELRALAGSYFAHQRPDHTLQPTALVHEAYLRLVDQPDAGWTGREHFFAVAAKAMRQILVDHARRTRADKRGGGWGRVTLDEAVSESVGNEVDFADLNDALTRLEALDARKAGVATLRFFGGLTLEATAQVLGVSRKTAVEDWTVARAFLGRELRKAIES